MNAVTLECHAGGVIGLGEPGAEIMGIGIAPGRDEWNHSKQPFTGQAGQVLRGYARAVGFQADRRGPIENWFLTNGLCWWKDSPTRTELEECYPRLRAEIDMVKPKLMVVFGLIMRDFLLPEQKRGWVQWSKKYNCWTMYTVHPSALLHTNDKKQEATQANQASDLMRDFMKIEDVLLWKPGPRPLPDYKFVDNLEEAQSIFDSFEDDELVALDIEARYKGSDEVLICGFSGEKGTWIFAGSLLGKLEWPKAVRWCMQNGLFDAAQLKKKFGVDLWIDEDTLLQSYSLDERGGKDNEVSGSGEMAVGIHNLQDMVCEYTGHEPWKQMVKKQGVIGTWDSGPEGQQKVIAYNACDAAYTREASVYFSRKQKADNVRTVYEDIMIPAANALKEIREYGGHISLDGFGDLVREWVPRWNQLEDELKSESGIDNLNSSQQIATYLYDWLQLPIPQVSKNRIKREQTKNERTTNRYALEEMLKQYEVPWLKKLIEFRQIDHLISTYLLGIEDDLQEDGRVHPMPIMQGTRTGRLAYHNPPIQTIPKHGTDLAKVRKLFDAPKGFEIMEADFRQLELWMAYFLSGDEALHESLKTGDFHAATTERVFGIPKEHPDFNFHRYESKRVTFGIFYGRGENSLTEAFGHTNQYWRAIIDKWAKEYHVYWDFIQRQKAQVRRTGEQQSVTGRKRRYHLVKEKALNSAINMPIQCTGHEQLLCSLTELQLDKLLEPYGAHILWEIHDSLVLESPVAMREEVMKVLTDCMTKPRFGLPSGLMVDFKYSGDGGTWYDCDDFETGLH